MSAVSRTLKQDTNEQHNQVRRTSASLLQRKE